jgi:hypothetical protein
MLAKYWMAVSSKLRFARFPASAGMTKCEFFEAPLKQYGRWAFAEAYQIEAGFA